MQDPYVFFPATGIALVIIAIITAYLGIKCYSKFSTNARFSRRTEELVAMSLQSPVEDGVAKFIQLI